MLVSVIVVSVFCIQTLVDQGGASPTVVPLGDTYAEMIGFAIYTFEGIGVIMPIMGNCKCPELYPRIHFAALFTLTIIYITFGTICYMALGSDMPEPIILNDLDPNNVVIIITKFLYSII